MYATILISGNIKIQILTEEDDRYRYYLSLET